MPDTPTLEALHARIERIEAALFHRPQVDPPPDDFAHWIGALGRFPIHIPIPIPIGDPPPIDFSRLTKAQLQLSLESIKAQRVRLDVVEKMVNEQIKQAR